MTQHRGTFVTVDGPGGVGKSTLVTALADLLRGHGHRVHSTREPSTRPIGAFTRTHADEISGHALACLVAADRYDHLVHEIRPQLAAGRTVVCDRYLASTLVVQRLDDVPEPFLLALNNDVTLPDLAVILTAEPHVVAERLTKRGAHHRFERDPGIPARELALYEQAARTLRGMDVPVLVLDTGNTTPSEAAAQIASSLARRPGSVGPSDPDPLTVAQ
ncbi:dTMP kinase [Streptomyces ferrugineus]|uniref:Thymidylate kinase n=1 Tax=Streptomyces ferrugineus TaxID=1413221 RepID=A0A7M2SNE8_9ACTN|nr:dTMP kinase [Streptomyces ferrugineus]QOV37003.1 dTMP kinase [Streptomyces ferrugineus]